MFDDARPARDADRPPGCRPGPAGDRMNRLARQHASTGPRVRADFPLLTRQVHGKPLIYFDSANTGQKPESVIDAVDDFYRHHNANVSRAVHTLGTEATDAYEGRAQQAGEVPQRARRRAGAVQRHHLRDQPGRLFVGAAAAAAGRCDRAHAHGAPRQHRAVAAGRRAHRRDDQGRRAQRARRTRPRRACTPC